MKLLFAFVIVLLGVVQALITAIGLIGIMLLVLGAPVLVVYLALHT